MKRTIGLVALFFASGLAHAAELRVSSAEPVVVTAPEKWTSAKEKSPGSAFPFETIGITPPTNRNAVCLISIYAKDQLAFADPEFLKTLLKADSRPYVKSPDDLEKIEVKQLKIKDGLAYYANFIDPDLVGKPVRKGSYKTATPIILTLGTKYLIKVTVLCDEIAGADYRDAMKMVESIRIRKE